DGGVEGELTTVGRPFTVGRLFQGRRRGPERPAPHKVALTFRAVQPALNSALTPRAAFPSARAVPASASCALHQTPGWRFRSDRFARGRRVRGRSTSGTRRS